MAVYVQIRKVRDALWSDTHSRLTEQSLELIKFLAEKPETYDYFYNSKFLQDDAPDRIFVLYAAEALANFMEHLSLQKKSLPLSQWLVWDRYIRGACIDSIVLRHFIDDHRSWYSPELLSIIDGLQLNENTMKE